MNETFIKKEINKNKGYLLGYSWGGFSNLNKKWFFYPSIFILLFFLLIFTKINLFFIFFLFIITFIHLVIYFKLYKKGWFWVVISLLLIGAGVL